MLNPYAKGAAFAILSALLYALKSALIKFAPQIPLEVMVFMRYFFDFIILSPFFIIYWKKLSTKNFFMHVLRGIIAVVSIRFSIYGMRNLVLVDAILLENTMSLFLPLVAWVRYREKISLNSIWILVLGFSSLFLLLKPKMEIMRLASFASIGTGFLCALQAMNIKTLSKNNHQLNILFYYTVFSGGLSLFPCLRNWDSTHIFTHWWIFALISLFGVLFQYALTRTYSLIPFHVAGSLEYSSVLFSALLGWIIWQETLDIMQICGGILLIGSGILMLWQNKREMILQNN